MSLPPASRRPRRAARTGRSSYSWSFGISKSCAIMRRPPHERQAAEHSRGVRDGRCDCFQDARAVGHDLVIVEAQNMKPFAGQESVSAGIALLMPRFEVLAAINFDGETRGIADEIH